MARPAAEAATVAALPRAEPGRLGRALRLAIVCALTAGVTVYYGTPEAALTIYIAFFLARPDRASGVLLPVVLTAMISVVIVLVVLLAQRVADAPAWRVAAMAGCSMLLLWLGAASKLKPIAAILALIVVYALALLDLAPNGELATRALLYAWLFVAIPAAVSLLVNLVAAPAPARLAGAALATQLQLAAAALVAPPPRPGVRVARPEAGGEDPRAALRLAGLEQWPDPRMREALGAAAQSLPVLLLLVDAVREEPGVPDAWYHAAAARLRAMAACFARGECPCEIEPLAAPAPTTARGRALAARFDAMLAAFPGPPPAAAAAARTPFLAADAWRNTTYLAYAGKTTAAAMACYFFYVLLDWPGIHTCLITCYIVALPTTAETVEKLTLRIVGCIAGAAAGLAALVWVVPTIDSLGALLLTVFAGAFAGSWIATGSPRIAYAGFQFAFAFFLCVVQGDGPAFDLTVARDRVIGILVGNAAIYLAFAAWWPVRIGPRIDAALAALRAQVLRLTRLPVPARQHELAGFQARLAAIEADLAVDHFEAATDPRRGIRRRALAAARMLAPTLFLDEDPRLLRSIAERLDPDAAPAALHAAAPTRRQQRIVALAAMLEKSDAAPR